MAPSVQDQNRNAEAKHDAIGAPVRKESLRQRGIIREPRNAAASPQGERTRQHSHQRDEERANKTGHDHLSARAEARDRAPWGAASRFVRRDDFSYSQVRVSNWSSGVRRLPSNGATLRYPHVV